MFLDNSNDTDLKITFGNLGGATSKALQFNSDGIVNGSTKIKYENIYGNEGTGNVDGLVIEGNIGSYSEIATPMVSYNESLDTYNNTNHEAHGFMAGFVKHNNSSAVGYWNTDHTDVDFNGIGKNLNGATIDLEDISSGSDSISTSFGSDASKGSFVIDDNLYALEQGATTITGSHSGSSSATDKGVLISGDTLSESIMQCSNCDYVHWGVWAAEIPVGAGSRTDVAELIPYIAGEITNSANLPKNMTGVYSGSVFGTIENSNNIAHHTGTVNATINFSPGGTASIAAGALGINIDSYSVENDATIGFTGSGFANAPIDSASGTVNGALFGPAAENLGGNFEFVNGSDTVNGVYMGSGTFTDNP